ncbi:MAG: hypothetical protein KC620_17795, partial [Myxococcales bacterium]|nr:hypothetical protein [Myxococcales bacterium]
AHNRIARLDLAGDQLMLSEGGYALGWLTLSGLVLPGPPVEGPPVAANPNAPNTGVVAQARASMAAPTDVHGALDGLADAALDRRTEGGITWFETARNVLGAPFTLVIYWPDGAQVPNVALLPPPASFDLARLLTDAVGMSDLGAVRVQQGVLLWVPDQNKTAAASVARLPTPMRTRIQVVDNRATLPLVGGQNIFGRLSLGDGILLGALHSIGFCDGDCGVRVNAAQGRFPEDACSVRDNASGWWLRLSRAQWDNVFNIDGVQMIEPTVEVRREQTRTLRAWAAQTRVQNKPYFLYGQCNLSACRQQNAFAFNAASVSLDDYATLIRTLGARALDGLPGGWDAGLNALPLDAVSIKSLDDPYDASANLDAAGRPRLQRMLGVFAGPQQRILGSERCVVGPETLARGRGNVLGRDVATLTADYWKAGHQNPRGRRRSGLYADATVDLGGWTPIVSGSGVLSVAKDDDQARMSLRAQVDIAGMLSQQVALAVTKQGISWSRNANCPDPTRIDISGSHDLAGGAGLRVDLGVDLNASCLVDVMQQAVEGARQAVGVAEDKTGDAFRAIGELGGAGIDVVEQCTREGWDHFEDAVEDTAEEIGQPLSDGWNATSSAGSDVVNTLNPFH